MNKEPIVPPPAPTYAQSKHMEKAPRPSFPAAPPGFNIRLSPNYANGEIAHTKNAREPRALLVGEAENADASEGPVI